MSEQVFEKGLLYGLKMPSSYTSLEQQSVKTLMEGLAMYPKALKMFQMLQVDPEVDALLNMANFIAVQKLGYNDHGPIHARIVAANGVRLLRILLDSGKVDIDSIKGLGMTEDDAHLIVVTGCMLHDIGNAIHRNQHEISSIVCAKGVLDRMLPEIYNDVSRRVAVTTQILHTLYAHDEGANALTIEAAVVVIADGCDITKGRGRLSFDLGKHDIHSISALSIESVDIRKGTDKLIEINVNMSNSAGIYQVQETLGSKVAASPLRDHVEIVAVLTPSKTPPEMKVLDRIVFSNGKYRNV
jgi:metal-dependent HD superfamily phosphatase/phosphodiesterase